MKHLNLYDTGSTEELRRTLAEFEDKVQERQETIEQVGNIDRIYSL